jgi:long-chain fatty acid transport protein
MARAKSINDLIIFAALAGAGASLWSGEASAAGFALREYGFDATSSAFAGASAQDDAPGFLATNPAASAGVDTWDAQFTLNAIYPTSEATYTLATTSLGGATGGRATPDDFINDGYEPGMSLRVRFSDDLTGGLAVSSPWGLGTQYGQGWAGRYYAIESKLLTVNVVPSLAYKLSDEFVVSAGLQTQYAKGTLSNAIDFGTLGVVNAVGGAVSGAQDGFVEYTASDWAFGYILGVMWTPSKSFSAGAFYRSAVDHDLEGKVDFTLDTSGIGATLSGLTGGAFTDTRAHTDLTTPAVAQIGARWNLTDEFALLAEAGFTQWGEFQELRAHFDNPAQPDNFQIYDYKDTWLGAVGLRYQPQSDWIVRAGVAFDESPTRDGTRDPRIPDSDRTWIAFGVHYDISASTALQVGYARLMFPDEPIMLSAATAGNEIKGNLAGRTDADADVVSIQFTAR